MAAARNYHHGNLKEAFLKAARDLLERDGLSGLSLRKCAEKVGVSHAAPKNHFGNMAGLLTASQYHWIAGDPVGQIMVYKQRLWVAGTIADTLFQAFPSLDWTIRKEKTDTITQKTTQ